MRGRAKAGGERLIADAVQRAASAEHDLALLTQAIEHLPVGIVVADEGGRPLARNRRAESPTGERTVDVLVAARIHAATSTAGAGQRHEETLELHGPPRRTVRVSAFPLGIGGVVTVVEDLSERSRLDAVRRDFVANVSHELRTPVGALAVLAEAIADANDPAVTSRLATRISIEVERASEMIAELLDLSRLEGDDPQAARRVVLTEVVDAASHRVAALAEKRGVTLDLSGVEDDTTVIGVHDQLVSALANLMTNAVKYSEPGMAVVVSARSEEGWVSIDVTDTGTGIPARDLDRIFERFYRVDRARDRRTGGTGLGLAIVRHVATNHSGEVLVRSVEGEGSTFTIRIPETAP